MPREFHGQRSRGTAIHGVAKGRTPEPPAPPPVGHSFPSKEHVSFNFMAAVTICSGFGAKKIKVVVTFSVVLLVVLR